MGKKYGVDLGKKPKTKPRKKTRQNRLRKAGVSSKNKRRDWQSRRSILLLRMNSKAAVCLHVLRRVPDSVAGVMVTCLRVMSFSSTRGSWKRRGSDQLNG